MRVAFLVYRGNPRCGGQGVYTRHLTRELSRRGHEVTVLSGQPYPELDDGVELVEVPSLDLYREPDPFRIPRPTELKRAIDLAEVAVMCSGGFPEPWTFSVRARRALTDLARGGRGFDVVHDNQSLGSGLLKMIADGWPLVATIHHPITVDRELDLAHAEGLMRRLSVRRWYGFVSMQRRVARRLPRVLTVSESSRRDLVLHLGVEAARVAVVPVGVDPRVFRQLAGIRAVPGRIMTTASADVPMKGLVPLLEALAKARTEHPDAHLVVVGSLKSNSAVPAVLERLGLEGAVSFVSGVSEQRIVELYAESVVAVVPSLYEGFSLPAIEAMACGVPLVATTGGAIPEVVGPDGGAALLVPPNDAGALAAGIVRLLAEPALRRRLGAAGRVRASSRFSWQETARLTEEQYRIGIEQSRALRARRPVLTVELERLALAPGASVLDLGCGGGRHAYACMRAGATVVALDADGGEVSEVAGMIAALEEEGGVSTGNAVVRGDALRLPFADGAFDRVICAEILEHIGDDRAAMAEVARVVRPGGLVAVTVPRYCPELISWTLSRQYHCVPGGHVRIYRRGQLVGRLRQAGLVPLASHHAHALHSPYWWLRCIVGTTRDDHPLVRAYHRLLVFDITSASPLTRVPERLLNPLIGKSLVVYLEKRAA